MPRKLYHQLESVSNTGDRDEDNLPTTLPPQQIEEDILRIFADKVSSLINSLLKGHYTLATTGRAHESSLGL